MIRRRPIPRSAYRWLPRPKPEHSQHYSTNPDNSVRTYRNGREVCQENAQGRREYARRVEIMRQRQGFRCCLCRERLSLSDATFEHQRRRGMGAGFRDDRIVDAAGNDLNGAAHWVCNSEKG